MKKIEIEWPKLSIANGSGNSTGSSKLIALSIKALAEVVIELIYVVAKNKEDKNKPKLESLAERFKYESNNTIPLPSDINERSFAQGKQQAYAHAFFELKKIIDE